MKPMLKGILKFCGGVYVIVNLVKLKKMLVGRPQSHPPTHTHTHTQIHTQIQGSGVQNGRRETNTQTYTHRQRHTHRQARVQRGKRVTHTHKHT